MLIQIMILSLPNVENILIDRKFFTRDELKKLKESRHYGRGICRVLGTFKRAVKENYELFFQSTLSVIYIYQIKNKLF
jgi:hypothetical protein